MKLGGINISLLKIGKTNQRLFNYENLFKTFSFKKSSDNTIIFWNYIRHVSSVQH
ncbi:hypothetical protein GCM10022258_40000 [Aquimarina gracilis]